DEGAPVRFAEGASFALQIEGSSDETRGLVVVGVGLQCGEQLLAHLGHGGDVRRPNGIPIRGLGLGLLVLHVGVRLGVIASAGRQCRPYESCDSEKCVPTGHCSSPPTKTAGRVSARLCGTATGDAGAIARRDVGTSFVTAFPPMSPIQQGSRRGTIT